MARTVISKDDDAPVVEALPPRVEGDETSLPVGEALLSATFSSESSKVSVSTFFLFFSACSMLTSFFAAAAMARDGGNAKWGNIFD